MAERQQMKYVKPKESSTQHDYSKEDAHEQLAEDAKRQKAQRKAGEIGVEQVAEIDELLDEIDLILEENEIATHYKQAGGE